MGLPQLPFRHASVRPALELPNLRRGVVEGNVFNPIDQERIAICRYTNAYQYAVIQSLLAILSTADGSESGRRKARVGDIAASCQK